MAVSIAEVSIRFTQDAQQVENVFHVTAPSPLIQADADAIKGVVDTWVKVTLRPWQANTVVYRELEVRDVNVGGTARFVYAGDGLVGTRTGTATPNSTTFSIKKNTALGGRKYRGRFYHIGLCQGDISQNTLSPTAVTALVSIYNALVTSLTTAGHPLLVAWRDYSVPKPHPIVGGIAVLTCTAVDATIDAQRRRLPGRGR